MKKFISILTTACVAATSMVGASLSTVNAADTMLFTYKAADGTSTVTVDVSGGDATVDCSMWITEYAPVYTMGIKQTWYTADKSESFLPEDNPYFTGTALSFTEPHVFIDPAWDEPVDYALKNANALPMNCVWQMGTMDENQEFPIDAHPSVDGEFQFMDMSFTVDAETPAGTYILDIRRETFVLDAAGTLSSTKLNNVAGDTVEYNTVPLTIVVTNGAEETTTTTTEDTTTTTTTTTTQSDGGETTTTTEQVIDGHTIKIDTVKVSLDEWTETGYVIVPVRVYGDPGTAGMTLDFEAEDNLMSVYKRYKAGDAYSGAPKFNKDTLYLVWASADGKNIVAEDGAIVFNLYFDLPADAAEGNFYPITFGFDMIAGDQEGEDPHIATMVVDQDGNDLAPNFLTGGIQITGAVETTTTEETTTTTEETTTTTTAEETTTTAEETTTTSEETTTTSEETTTTTTTEETTTTTTTTTTVTPGTALPGDTNVDGRVSIADVVKLNKYLAGNDQLTPQGLINAEVNADGVVDNADSIKIMQWLAKMDVVLGQA